MKATQDRQFVCGLYCVSLAHVLIQLLVLLLLKSRQFNLYPYILALFLYVLCTHRQESGVRKFAIQRVKGICGISDVLQFASVQDMVHFFTLHPFEIGVKLKPMNVTEHYQLQQLPNGSTPHGAHSCSQVSMVLLASGLSCTYVCAI